MREPESGIHWEKLVALSHEVEILRPLPPCGTVTSSMRVTDVFDRGAGKGAIIRWERERFDPNSGDPLSRITGRALARADGGFGGTDPPRPQHPGFPSSAPDFVSEWKTSPAQALVYRLSGDMNPLHADPIVAQIAGLDRPVLHGLCNLGIATLAVIRFCGNYDPMSLTKIGARYSNVFYPGDTLRTEIWRAGNIAVFRCKSLATGSIVLDDGVASLAPRA